FWWNRRAALIRIQRREVLGHINKDSQTPVGFKACDFGPCEPEIVLRSSPSRRRSPWLLRTKSRARAVAAYRTVGLGPQSAICRRRRALPISACPDPIVPRLASGTGCRSP